MIRFSVPMPSILKSRSLPVYTGFFELFNPVLLRELSMLVYLTASSTQFVKKMFGPLILKIINAPIAKD